MLFRLILAFVTIPLAELAVLVWLGDHVGLLPTLVLVVVTGILGAALARQQGVAAWQRFRAALDQAGVTGRPPHRELVEGLLVLVAAAVLLTPGLLTDLAGFALLVPPVRRRAGALLVAWIGRRFLVRTAGGRGGRPTGDALDVEFQVVDVEEGAEDPEGPRRLS